MQFKEIWYNSGFEFSKECSKFQEGDEVSEEILITAVNFAKDSYLSRENEYIFHLSMIYEAIVDMKYSKELNDNKSDIGNVYQLLRAISYLQQDREFESYDINNLCQKAFALVIENDKLNYNLIPNTATMIDECNPKEILDINKHLKLFAKLGESDSYFMTRLQPFLNIYNIKLGE